jgi:hypothetical protein
MLKKPLIKAKIYDYMDENKLETVEDVMKNRKGLFEYLKAIPDLELENLSFTVFCQQVERAYQGALVAQQLNAQMNAYFNGFKKAQ